MSSSTEVPPENHRKSLNLVVILRGSSGKMKNFPSILSNEKRSKESKRQNSMMSQSKQNSKRNKQNKDSKRFLRICAHLQNKSLTHLRPVLSII